MPGEPAQKRPRRSGVAAAPVGDVTAAVSAERSGPKPAMSSISLQKCAFIPVPAAGITALASSPSGLHVALARSGGSLELLSPSGPTASRWIPSSLMPAPAPSASPAEISSLAFQPLPGASLWVARMDGTVSLLAISQAGLPSSVSSSRTIALGGGSVWALAVHPTDPNTVAAACDDGSVRIVEDGPSSGGLAVIRVCGKTDARVLCVDWTPRGGIVCGDSGGGVRWVDPASGRVVGRGVLRGRRVWSLCFAKSGKEVVCGDSRGRVSVWNSASCTVSDELTVENMDGDVMAVASTLSVAAGETVLVGSVSGAIGGIMAAPNARPGDPWAPLRARRLHTHDVRALARVCSSTTVDSTKKSPTFVSGGLDATMCGFGMSTLLKDAHPTRMRPLALSGGPSAQPTVQFVARQGAVVARHPNHVDVWRLYPHSRPPAHLFRLSLAGSLGPTISAVAVSSSLRLVAVSAAGAARLYSITPVVKDAKNRRVHHSAASPFAGKIRTTLAASDPILMALIGSPDMVFAGKNPVLIAISQDRTSIVAITGLQAPTDLEDSDNDMGVAATRWGMCEHLGCARGTARLVRLVASPAVAGRFAVSDSAGLVSVIDVGDDGGEDGQCAPVPIASHRVRGLVMAMGFSADGSRLVMTTSTGAMFVADLVSKQVLTLNHVPAKVACAATSLSFSPDSTSVVLSGGDTCYVVGLEVPCATSYEQNDVEKPAPSSHDLGRHENIIGSCVLGKNRLALVHRPWNLVAQSLPSMMPRKVFGA
jgi:WD40 repeat protein